MKMNWLLVGVAAIVALCVYHGYKCGLVRMLFSIVTFIVTIFLVRLLAPVGVQALKNTDVIYDAIKAPIEKVLEEQIDGQVKTEEVLESCQVSDDVKENIMAMADKTGITEVAIFTPEVKGIAADCITLRIIDLLAYIILFIVINIGLRVLGSVLDLFSKLPIIKDMNKLGGCIFGAIEGLAIVWLVFIVITIFSTTGWGSACFEMIGDSAILSILYAKNIFLVFV